MLVKLKRYIIEGTRIRELKVSYSLPDTFFVLNGDMELHRNWKFFI